MSEPLRFALVGAAGFVAPRHMRAITETGNSLVAACDPHDSVGILDSYAPDAMFFIETERMDRFIDSCRHKPLQSIDYLSVCSPNYLHDAHVRMGLRSGCNVICEKPLVINPWNLDFLERVEEESEGSVHTVLQLRAHPDLQKLKSQVEATEHRHKCQLTYVTPRGPWYSRSWKGDKSKSGGIVTNIGIHLFDAILWIFGSCETFDVESMCDERVEGRLITKRADVRWVLSCSSADNPVRHIDVDDMYRIEFSSGFRDLHTEVYKSIIAGNGCGIAEARRSIELTYRIRSSA